MRTFSSLIFLLSPVFELLAKIQFTAAIDGNLDEIYKILVISQNPSHYVSFWKKNDTDDKTFRFVSFQLSLDVVTKMARIKVYTPLDPNNRSNKNTDWLETWLGDFTAPPINFVSRHEFLYYFTVYDGAIYFTMPTTNGTETIIRSVGKWLTAPPPVFQLACGQCTGADQIYFSKLNWKKKREDVVEKWQQAQCVNRNCDRNEPNIDDQTRRRLNNFREDNWSV